MKRDIGTIRIKVDTGNLNSKRTREIKIEIINNLLEQTEMALEKELTKNGQCISPERTLALTGLLQLLLNTNASTIQ